MKNVEDALLRLVKAAKKLKRMADALDAAGMGSELLFSCYGDIIDGIYHLIGENTGEYTDSETCKVMGTVSLSDERAAALLMNVYKRNIQPKMPKPILMSPDELFRMQKQNGYTTPEGDWL